MDIKSVYQKLSGDREHYLEDAHSTAELFAPTLAPKGEVIEQQPFTDKGIQAARSLSSNVAKTMIPGGVQYFELDLPKWAWSRIFSALASRRGMDARQLDQFALSLRRRFRQRAQDMMDTLEQKNIRSKLSRFIRRNLVEGANGLNNAVDAIRVFPLRNIVIKRDSGMDDFMIFRESLNESALDKNFKLDSGELSEEQFLYTLVRFPRIDPANPGRMLQEPGVWQQVGSKEPKMLERESWRQWWYMTGELPDIEDYSRGYLHSLLRLVSQIDLSQKSLGQAIATAGFNVPLFRPGSTLEDQMDEVHKWKAGEPKSGNPDDVGWFTANLDIGKWTFVVALLEQLNESLANATAMGIKDRPIGGDTSATAVLQIIDELNTQTQELMVSIEETGLKPLIHSEFDLHERTMGPVAPELAGNLSDFMEIKITTGVNALEKQRSLLRVLPLVDVFEKDIRFEWNMNELADRLFESMRIRNDGLYRRRSDEEVASILAAQAGEDAPTPRQRPREREGTMMTRGGPQNPQQQSQIQPAGSGA